jgi:hypothetical protein
MQACSQKQISSTVPLLEGHLSHLEFSRQVTTTTHPFTATSSTITNNSRRGIIRRNLFPCGIAKSSASISSSSG